MSNGGENNPDWAKLAPPQVPNKVSESEAAMGDGETVVEYRPEPDDDKWRNIAAKQLGISPTL